jgi:hypothetical protein
MVANSGNFIESTPLIWNSGSPFAEFLAFGDWLFAETGRSHGIALTKLAEYVFRYLTEKAGREQPHAAETVWRDYLRGGRSDMPLFLRGYDLTMESARTPKGSDLARQGRFTAPTGTAQSCTPEGRG